MKIASIAAAAALLLAGCSKSDGNWLIGTWVLDGAHDAGCYSPIAFTDSQQTLTMGGKPSLTSVTYNIQPKEIWVFGDLGLRVGYKRLDNGDIKLDSWVNCTWKKQ